MINPYNSRAATVVGLTSIFGYASTTLSGWDAGFAGLMACAVAGTVLLTTVWPAKAQGYKT
jgi:hypothetical protein